MRTYRASFARPIDTIHGADSALITPRAGVRWLGQRLKNIGTTGTSYKNATRNEKNRERTFFYFWSFFGPPYTTTQRTRQARFRTTEWRGRGPTRSAEEEDPAIENRVERHATQNRQTRTKTNHARRGKAQWQNRAEKHTCFQNLEPPKKNIRKYTNNAIQDLIKIAHPNFAKIT